MWVLIFAMLCFCRTNVIDREVARRGDEDSDRRNGPCAGARYLTHRRVTRRLFTLYRRYTVQHNVVVALVSCDQ